MKAICRTCHAILEADTALQLLVDARNHEARNVGHVVHNVSGGERS
jgi:hypothetical protein